ncbi:TM1812 family CRISPR-associated protein [Ruminococcus sp. HUN007]|uniref:TM1812 family CRISPR-associated protein n=1 Tax=Ruminococcus sp. HUN007 TaxID=1514668 RepID=UPI0005D138CF|nr:TM1812 family CRISPR-associated protein [Ruminococcus sp. HUN007]
MKKFYTISPFQNPETMKEGVVYTPENNPDLEFGATSFPIIPVINAYAQKGEQIEIITITSESTAGFDNAEKNKEIFIQSLEDLKKQKGFTYHETPITIPFSSDIDTQIEMFSKLIDTAADEDEIYADITYGTKVMSQVLTMSINYAYRLHSNVTLGCIVYGEVVHNPGEKKGKIYDETSMNYMDEIVRLMAETKIKNPTEHIKRMLK